MENFQEFFQHKSLIIIKLTYFDLLHPWKVFRKGMERKHFSIEKRLTTYD